MAANRGFVLPTIAILLLIMSLVVSSLLFRSLNRTTQVIGERNQQVIYNAATPAIDRAKAKIEFLFRQDPRFPGGLPSDRDLDEILKNTKPDIQDIAPATAGVQNPYDFPGETRIDINNDNTLDNAWSFKLDINGDGNEETIAYSILTRTADDLGTPNNTSDDIDRTASDSYKASSLIVRNGPINLVRSSDPACQDIYGAPDAGWDQLGAALVRRAFQVTALAIDPNNRASRTVATLEMQQDRQAEKGNKWGAWFRNDLEIFPGPVFRWNGSMHTEGNLIIGGTSVNTYLISSPNSCLYTRENSEITVGGTSDETTPPFLGQIMSGSLRNNDFEANSSSNFDIYGVHGKSSTYALTPDTDSTATPGGQTPTNISLDPVVLFTTNQNRNRNGDPDNKTNVRDPAWKDTDVVKQGRILNKSARAPYVDDTYRADNRYGPKPEYNDRIDLNSQTIGTTIPTTDPNYATLTNLSTTIPENQGLDGYWERRARAEGLRIIVGQRLELGNAYGWQVARDLNGNGNTNDFNETDPLYPPVPNAANGSSMANRAHEQRQWKTLRDNLAAVQSTALYHSAGNDPDFPIACLASTAHPGTQTTITNSATFNNIFGSRINTDFLTGRGTNGWEFNPPAANAPAFESAIANGQPLGNVLRNLSRFAGDPFGAFPARQDTTASPAVPAVGAVVHPEPNLTTWGNFSNLRQALEQLDSGTTYANLSVADKSTLQTAACTLGMLAYNLDNLRDYDYTNTTNRTALQNLNIALQADLDGTGSQLAGQGLPSSATPDSYINALSGANQNLARLVHLKEQVARDRRFGFDTVPTTLNRYRYQVQFVSNFNYGGETYSSTAGTPPGAVNIIDLGFDFSTATGNNFFGFGNPNTVGDLDGDGSSLDDRQDAERRFIRLATSIAPKREQPKFPSLFYLFPVAAHNHRGTATATALAADPSATVTQPNTEPYVSSPYVSNSAINGSYIYRVPQDSNNNGIENGVEDGIGAIAIQPRTRANWLTPDTATMTGRVNRITDNGTPVAVGFLDKGIFNGREMMSVRVLDLDLDLLRRNTTIGGETWLPYSGIIYAFREDAMREDGIARPAATTTWANCDTATEIVSATCRMNAVVANSVDPPLNPTTGISPKPVDFYADPDRRPHGFRLRNGADLRRIPAPPPDFALRGLAFISDNLVYIMGDNLAFNLHQTGGGTRIEEFTDLLGTDNDGTDWDDFYTRTTPNQNFARAGDAWRPAEIIADAISLLSPNFVDGSIAEGIRRRNIAGTSSYRNLNAPSDGNPTDNDTGTRRWVREDGSFSDDKAAPIPPIKISRNGFPVYCVRTVAPLGDVTVNSNTPNSCIPASNRREQEYGREATPLAYMTFADQKALPNAPNNTRINATIVSGVVPSRAGQSYGGMHNFPRFLENWNNQNLHIAGAFIQLNFSTSATAPFDQEKRGNAVGEDGWEPNNTLTDGDRDNAETIGYYAPPLRRWGYDVGLQYAPAGPVARRFVTPSNTRSEFYRELPIDDPYVRRLRCAMVSGIRIDPQATSSDCIP